MFEQFYFIFHPNTEAAMKKIALALATVMVAFLGCGGDDPTTKTPDESGTPPIEGGSEGEDSPPVEPACKRTATCGDPATPPPVDDRPALPDDENLPPPPADPCKEFPWLQAAAGKQFRCEYPDVGDEVCTLELPKELDGDCTAKCDPSFYENAEKFNLLEDGRISVHHRDDQPFFCSPLN